MLFNREKAAFYFKDLETTTGKIINLSIVGLILLSSVIFVAQTYQLSPVIRQQLDILDRIILFLFVGEYILRLWSAENKIKYIFSLYAIVDLLAILPFLLGSFNISFIRLFRSLRILRLVRFITKISIFNTVITEDSLIFAKILFTLFAIVFVFSGLIYQVEHPINQGQFTTFIDAFYFSIVTMTTVGFGDVTPISSSGRLLTVLMILTGIALIPWQVGDLIKRLVKTANQVEIICSGCGLTFHDTDAQFCKRCGNKIT
jgi:voltage-gated potassium channel